MYDNRIFEQKFLTTFHEQKEFISVKVFKRGNFHCHKLFQQVSFWAWNFRSEGQSRSFDKLATNNDSVSFASLIDLISSACTVNHFEHSMCSTAFSRTSFKPLMHVLNSKLSLNMLALWVHLQAFQELISIVDVQSCHQRETRVQIGTTNQ